MLSIVNYFVKVICYTGYDEKLKSIIEETEKDIFRPIDVKSKEIIRRTMRIWKIVFRFYMTTCISVVSLWAACAFLTSNEIALPFRYWYPFDVGSSPVYEIIFAYEVVGILLMVISHVTLDVSVAGIMAFIIGQINILNDNLRDIDCEGEIAIKTQIRCFTLHRNIKRIRGVLEDISLDIFEPKDKQSEDVTKKAMAYSKRIFYIYVITCCSFGFLLGAGAIISEEHNALPFNFSYPFDKTHGFGYKVALAYEALSISSNAMTHATMDCVVYSILAFVRVQLSLLNEDLCNLGSIQYNTYQASLEQQILCIEKHQAIKRIVKELNEIITFPMFVQSTLSAITLCMSVYKLTGVELLSEEGISYIMYCAVMHAQLGIPFWYGNEIISKSNELTISAYQCNWIEENKHFKSNLLIFLMSTIKPIEVSGGYFIVMSLEPLITNNMPLTREQILDYKEIFKECVENLITDDTFIQRLGNALTKTIENSIKVALKTYSDTLKTYSASIDQLKEENLTLRNKMDNLEQYSRRNNIRISGLVEEQNENLQEKVLNFCRDKLNVSAESRDIDRVHRLGKPGKTSPRCVIIKFTNYGSKQKILAARKKLKGSKEKCFVTEDLTKSRYELYRAAQDKWGVKHVWTQDGRIKVKLSNKVITVQSLKDLTAS
ncbi:odorant receptor [Holotrichia oblita]|uniref:Odorant receptor n=1 Tax=Holotrichia oblita TaxID=644536 RepID=A0ACB9SV78_HOLOL|nr:odorant receptor [Holotrichia oblita]